jgi:hypothetical protein
MSPGAVRRVALAAAVIGAGALVVPALANAPARRYTAAGGVVNDTMTKLAWQQLVGAQRYSFDDAKVYCEGLNLKGTGWRVPTIKELETIVDDATGIDPVFLPTTDPSYPPDSTRGSYWSSTRMVAYDSEAWLVSFSAGGAPGPAYTLLTHYVRCVR